MEHNVIVLFFVIVAVTSAMHPASGRIHKRADDLNPLETVITQLTAELNELKAQHQALTAQVNGIQTKEGQRAAFFARFSVLAVTTPASGPYKFDQVMLNEGNVYDPTLGVFTAPFSGVYVMSVKLYERGPQATRPIVDLKVNGSVLDRMGFDQATTSSNHGDNSRSTSLTTRLQGGDKVWVECYAGTFAYTLWGTYHSYFSATLIHSD